MTLVRNETQRHSAALKIAGQNPVVLLPLNRVEKVPRALAHYSASTIHVRISRALL